jgi:hypothetical protein
VTRPRPELKVEVGFGAPPLQALASVVWTDVSSYVWLEQAPISITRGRSSELSQVDPSRLTLTLKNTDRRFDPDTYYSPYYPNVKPRARIRVRARWPRVTGTWRDLYTGYVQGWKPVYLGGRVAACRVTAIDAFSLFARRQVSLTISSGAGEAPAAAIQNVLNVMGWPAGDRSFTDPSSTILPETTFTNAKALEAIQQIAKADDGLLFVGRDGKVTYHDRNYRASNRTPIAIIGNEEDQQTVWVLGTSDLGVNNVLRPAGWVAGTQSTELPYKSLELLEDDAKLRNDVRMTRVGGVEQVAGDTDSQAAYDVMSYAETGLLLRTDGEANDRAEAFLARYKDPMLRAESLTLTGELANASHVNQTAYWDRVIESDVDNLLQIIVRPPGGGWTDLSCWTEQVTHTISRQEWQVTYGLSRDDPTPYLILDDDTLGLLDTTFLGY